MAATTCTRTLRYVGQTLQICLAVTAKEKNADISKDRSFSGTWRACGRGKGDATRDESDRDVSNNFVAMWIAPCPLVFVLIPCNRIIDLSHTSDAAQKQALSLSMAPVIFSHSSWSVSLVFALFIAAIVGIVRTANIRKASLCAHIHGTALTKSWIF